ncbi:MAG: ribonuclease R [Oscillospiraceae bacterium]
MKEEMKEVFRKRIVLFLQKAGKKCMVPRQLEAKCHVKGKDLASFKEALSELKKQGIVSENRRGLFLSSAVGAYSAKVARINKTFGFLTRLDDNSEVFVPGKYLMGAMPGDTVLARPIPSRQGGAEGEVIKILEESKAQFTGVVLKEDDKYFILPDTIMKSPILLEKTNGAEVGDKVLAEIAHRGLRHSEHTAKVVSAYGSSMKASACAQSVLELHGVCTEFPLEVSDEAKRIEHKGITPEEISRREDLRDTLIFTIDGADTKDIDDAISLSKTETCYKLGVHIADVSYYVRPKSALDNEAFDRGTSVYYADRVVPMLPKELSNGICSLNPNEDRLAFSCLMDISFEGKLLNYEFKKTAIRSRVKGVYTEINAILDGSATDEIKEKYKDCLNTIFLMQELASILTENKIKRGAPQIETPESKLIISEDDICIDVKNKERGKSELIIEEFMLMANQSAANFGKLNEIPFVYRIHEEPMPEKVQTLISNLDKMGIKYPHFDEIKPYHIAQIIEKQRGTDMFPVINNMALRSMAKAKYSTEPVGHFGLVLSDYAHFTSPIRRYPDLSIHRIMSDMLEGTSAEMIKKKYTEFANVSANHSTDAELTAMTCERECEDCYKAEYMSGHIGEDFDAIISSVTDYGFYVELPNTVEGLVHIDALPHGTYDCDGFITLTESLSGKRYRVGDRLKVRCIKADVSGGKVDFSVVSENE